MACQNLRNTLVEWGKCNEQLHWGFRNNLVETDLPNQIARLNRMHRAICVIDDLMHVADGIDLLFRYRPFTPSTVSILMLIRDLQKVCQTNEWLFEDRAPLLAYKVDLLRRRHQLRGIRGTTRLGCRRYGCAPVRTQDLIIQLWKYYRLEELTGPYAYNAVAPGVPIDLVQLATIY